MFDIFLYNIISHVRVHIDLFLPVLPVSGEGGVPGRVVLAEPRPLPRPRPQDAPNHLSARCQGRNHNKVDETLKQYVNNGTNITERRMTLNGHTWE